MSDSNAVAAPGLQSNAPTVVYVERRGNGLAVGALVCGIVGSVFGLIPLLYIVALALGIVALVLGISGRRKASRHPEVGRKTMATWGVVLGVASLALGSAGAVIVNNAVDELDRDLQQIDRDFQRDMQQLEQEYSTP